MSKEANIWREFTYLRREYRCKNSSKDTYEIQVWKEPSKIQKTGSWGVVYYISPQLLNKVKKVYNV